MRTILSFEEGFEAGLRAIQDVRSRAKQRQGTGEGLGPL